VQVSSAGEGARVREEVTADVAAVRAVTAAAFGGDRVPRLLDDLRRSAAWPGSAYVAVVAGEVVGCVCYSRGWVDAPARLVDVLVLSPLAVRPDLQGQGIGSRLVRESLALLDGRDEPLVFLEGDPGFYGRLGFRSAEPLGFTAPSVRIPGPAFQVVTRAGYDEARMTGALVYPDAFWRHDCVGLRPAASA
jgi:putative acetyltransferase